MFWLISDMLGPPTSMHRGLCSHITGLLLQGPKVGVAKGGDSDSTPLLHHVALRQGIRGLWQLKGLTGVVRGSGPDLVPEGLSC